MDPDSQNIRLLGRALLRGQIAYVDLFDHKGPYVYLIEYLAAIIFPHSEWGIFLIEVLFYSINIYIAYETAKLFCGKKEAIITSIIFLGISFDFFTFVTGNLTDSYSVSLQIITLFIVAIYYKSGMVEHPPTYMLVYGLTASLCGLMRSVNAGGWILLGIILAIRLFYFKKIVNFFQNLLALGLGIAVGVAPALVYGIRNALKRLHIPMIVCTVVVITLACNLQFIKQITKYGDFHYHYEAAYAMKDIINDPDANVWVTGTNSVYYNVTDTVSHIKYFIIYGNGLHYAVFSDAVNMQSDSLLSGENEYVVVVRYNGDKIFFIREIDKQVEEYLSEYYTEVFKTPEKSDVTLYKKNQISE